MRSDDVTRRINEHSTLLREPEGDVDLAGGAVLAVNIAVDPWLS
jgi:hypothetical protein